MNRWDYSEILVFLYEKVGLFRHFSVIFKNLLMFNKYILINVKKVMCFMFSFQQSQEV